MTNSLRFLCVNKTFINFSNINIPANTILLNQTCCRHMSTTTSSEIEENFRPISEMPGLNTFAMAKALLTKKIKYKGQAVDFDSSQAHKVWGSFRKLYGPIFKLSIIGEPTAVAVTDPDDIEKMYRVTMDNPVRIGFNSLKKVRDEAIDNYFEKKAGLLTENYEEWRRVRSKVQTPVMKPKNIVRYLTQMDEVSLEFVERIALLQKKHGEMPNDFQQHLYKWALESVGTVALNRRLGCLDPNLSSDSSQMKLIDAVNEMFICLNKTEMEFPWWRFVPSPTLKKLKKHHEVVLSIVHDHIMEAEKVFENKYSGTNIDSKELTLLEILLQTEGLTRKDVITFMMDFFFAGIDTTSHTLGFTLYLLARNKNVQKRLQEEIDEVLGDGKGPITEAQMAKLSYLKVCVKESLRVYPLAIGNARLLLEDAVLCGYKIPKGHMIISATVISAKDEKCFTRAEEYLPERWMRNSPLGTIHPFASLPFSTGTRMCIGRRIAEQEMYTFLARVLHRFNVDYKYKDMEIYSRIVAMPSEPLRFQFTERK